MKERLLSLEREAYSGFQCSIYMGGHSVNVYSKVDIFLPSLMEGTADYISSFPGWKVEQEQSNSCYSIVYLPGSEPEIQYIKERNVVLAMGELEDYKSGQALAYLGFWLMELQRQSDSMFTIHSSALALEENGVLLMGHEGAGKTSILLGMIKEYGGEVISNDLTVVKHNSDEGNMVLVDGTKKYA